MHCRSCGRSLAGNERNCPGCGRPVAEKLLGTLKTSTIFISADNVRGVYHSVQEVPEILRKKLLRSTNSMNSRTILIADRRGRQEIERALRKLNGASKRRLSGSLLSGRVLVPALKLTVPQALGILLAGATGLVAWMILSHNW